MKWFKKLIALFKKEKPQFAEYLFKYEIENSDEDYKGMWHV